MPVFMWQWNSEALQRAKVDKISKNDFLSLLWKYDVILIIFYIEHDFINVINNLW